MLRVHRCVALAALVAGVIAAAPSPAHAAPAKVSPPSVYANAATVVTAEGTVLWAKNSNKKRPVASTIKLLNALVARDKADMARKITVTRDAARIYNGTVGLQAGQKLTVRELLSIMLVHSANDAAEALGVGIAGSEKKYVAMMNAKAKELGLKHTKAADPHGLGKHERSTAADLAVIARHVMADPELRQIVSRRACRVPRPGGGSDVYGTTNRLLGSYRGITGVKTGYTDPAGYCFVGSAKRNGIELYCVVLGGGSSEDRFVQGRRLLDWGFAHVRLKELVSREETMGAVEVERGSESAVTVHPAESLSLTVGDCGDALTTRVSLPASAPAPISPGQRLGTVQVVRKNSVVASVPLIADCGVARRSVSLGFAPAKPAQAAAPEGFFARVADMIAGIGRLLGM